MIIKDREAWLRPKSPGQRGSHLIGAWVDKGIVLTASETMKIVFCLLLDCFLSRHFLWGCGLFLFLLLFLIWCVSWNHRFQRRILFLVIRNWRAAEQDSCEGIHQGSWISSRRWELPADKKKKDLQVPMLCLPCLCIRQIYNSDGFHYFPYPSHLLLNAYCVWWHGLDTENTEIGKRFSNKCTS